MRSKTARQALSDIRDNVLLAQGFLTGYSLERFVADRRTVYAVTRCLEIISEASRRVPDEVKVRYPDIPWRDIAGAGSIYRHDYQSLMEERLWATATTRLSALLAAVEQELAALDVHEADRNSS